MTYTVTSCNNVHYIHVHVHVYDCIHLQYCNIIHLHYIHIAYGNVRKVLMITV